MKELSPKYNHLEVENGKYDFWVKGGFFSSGDKSKLPFCVVIPPPNVTGKLHLGHAWDVTLQDIIIRRKRMQGYDALWLPGMDHAGIATQAKVDARLKEQGVSRYDIGREAFLEKAWEWKHEYAETIHKQWAKCGISVDYNKERFTLDEGLNRAVNKVFITLYNKGLIYQGERIINWDPEAKTALSNIEVEYKDTPGAFYHLMYKFVGEEGGLVCATTRPETLFADQAVMINPNDEVNAKYIGKKVIIPGTDTVIPVIGDDYVELGFGTGIVKVTPAHDPNDYEVGIRHNLPMPSCMNDDATMNEMAGKYEGMDRFECRKALVKDLQEAGLCLKIDEIMHNVGFSERTHCMVEPRLSKQWFVKMDVLAKQLLDNQETDGKVNFVPERFEKTLINWMSDVHDWCISRQLWWGHRIPAWYKYEEVKVQVECPGEGWTQDEDVLDTWFSSALWPFSTLGWPDSTEDLERYFPTDVLVTGYDIIFFWVSRMVFQSLEFTGKRPFKDVLIHGLIRDSQGRKMSKSLGNGVDPMDMIDQYGCDALRYYLTTNSTPGQDLRFSEEKISASWNYINKIWNISRYIFMNVKEVKEFKFEELDVLSKWVLTELSDTILEADRNFDKYEFGEAARVIYNFTWDTFASWFVEMSKVSLQNEAQKENTKAVLVYVLDKVIKLLHPFMPFVTEEIYQLMPNKDAESIVISAWPKAEYSDRDSQKQVNILTSIIGAVRNLRAEKQVKPSKPLDMTFVCDTEEIKNGLSGLTEYINKFCCPANLVITTSYSADSNDVSLVLNGVTVYLPLSGLVDLNEEKARLEKELAKLEGEIKRGEGMLSNENFVKKAPEAKINAEREKLANYKNQYEKTRKALAELA